MMSVIRTAAASLIILSTLVASTDFNIFNVVLGDNGMSETLPYIFVHACVGVFYKKRGNGTWGHGQEILEEMIHSIIASNISLGALFIGVVGASGDIQNTRNMLRMNIPIWFQRKVHIILSENSIELAEFPTLDAMQKFAMLVPPDTKLAYMHTKGVRKNGIGNFPNEWRQYMTYFIIERHEMCFQALDDLSYCTCGALKQGKIYAGNFWWSKAGYLASRKPLVSDIPWTMQNRFAAEEYLFMNQTIPSKDICSGRSSHSNFHSLHYCVHHTHHIMQLCHTPRQWYVHVTSKLRADPQCFFRKLLPQNPKKNDPSTWCHLTGLPEIPNFK